MRWIRLLIPAIALIILACAHDSSPDRPVMNLSGLQVLTPQQRFTADSFTRHITNRDRLSSIDELKLIYSRADSTGALHERYQQVHQGIPVEGAIVMVHSRNREVYAISGHARAVDGVATKPLIEERKALETALSFEKLPEDFLIRSGGMPAGALIVTRYGNRTQAGATSAAGSDPVLAWSFVIAALPHTRKRVYVNAISGEKLGEIPLVDEVTGTAKTRYSGDQPIETDPWQGQYRLHDYSQLPGGIITKNLQTGHNPAVASDFVDPDNLWILFNPSFDEVALDAHWGAEMTYRYFGDIHGHWSWDGTNAKPMLSYVHYGSQYTGAFWDGQATFYGDGGGSVNPRPSLDVVAHEFAHGVKDGTVGDFSDYWEPGSINEGLSDIWATCVENFVMENGFLQQPKNLWIFEEEIYANGLRSLKQPNDTLNPDTYKGDLWNFTANSPQHRNSTVLSHWFYLFASGVDDINPPYGSSDFFYATITEAIGIKTAEKIVYHAEAFYLWPEANYEDIRAATILSAVDLYGAGSYPAIAAEKAWNRVGVSPSPFSNGPATACVPPNLWPYSIGQWIAGVQFGSIDGVKSLQNPIVWSAAYLPNGNSGGGSGTSAPARYRDYSLYYDQYHEGGGGGVPQGLVLFASAGTNVPFHLKPSSNGLAVTWSVWVDLDHDGNFGNEEIVYQTAAPVSGVVESSIFIPAQALPGMTRMRVRLDGQLKEACAGIDMQGEVEDYAINVLPAIGSAPKNPVVKSILSNAVHITWDEVDYASQYIVKYRMQGANPWIIVNVPEPKAEVFLQGLVPGNKYDVEIIGILDADIHNRIKQGLPYTYLPPSYYSAMTEAATLTLANP